jgi:hypothetical protein
MKDNKLIFKGTYDFAARAIDISGEYLITYTNSTIYMYK